MDIADDITAKVEAVQKLLNEKIGVRKRALHKMLRSAGRRLPRRMRAQGQVLVKAVGQTAHPKLLRQVDLPAVQQAHKELTAHLSGIDVMDRRKGVALGLAGSIAFNIIAVACGFVLWMWWRGYV